MNVCVGEEERQRAHEALQQQEAELARYAEQVAAQGQEAEALQAKIKAMEDKVTCQAYLGCLIWPRCQSHLFGLGHH